MLFVLTATKKLKLHLAVLDCIITASVHMFLDRQPYYNLFFLANRQLMFQVRQWLFPAILEGGILPCA